MSEKCGTAEKLGELGPYEVYDDGALDYDVVAEVDGTDQIGVLAAIREQFDDDEAFGQFLAQLTGSDGASGADGTGGSLLFDRKPPASKCPGCNLTYPRTMTDDEGYCPECQEERS